MFGCSDVYHWMGRAACPTRHLGSGVGVASLPSSILPIPTLGNGRLFQGFDFGDIKLITWSAREARTLPSNAVA